MREHRFIVFRQSTDHRGRATAVPTIGDCLGSVMLPYSAKAGGWMAAQEAVKSLWGPGGYVLLPDPREKADELWPGWSHNRHAMTPALPIVVPGAPKPAETAVSTSNQ
jgi:hypothetical protein